MKILIAGLPKSGTTILTYRIAGALEDVLVDFEPLDGNLPPDGDHQHVITKKLVGSQTSDFDPYADYDRKIWICRDPRDFLVSQALYRWHREETPTAEDRARFEQMLGVLRAKEDRPAAIDFLELEPAHYFETFDAIVALRERALDDQWFVYPYESMIDGDYHALNAYLGFQVAIDAEVADGLQRVARRKRSGDWRDWFTERDVAFYRSGGLSNYMASFGYDPDDWQLNRPQVIQPRHASEYCVGLFDGAIGSTVKEPKPADRRLAGRLRRSSLARLRKRTA